MDIPTDVPTSARLYGWYLGGKDNYEIDRRFAMLNLPDFPETVDVTRQNRLFLYRAVRYLVQEAGIRQFLDMGCGLPTNDNVHQVAQKFAPDSRVVYVDIDPIVLAHARALLSEDDSTTIITADLRDPEAILAREEVTRLLDLSQPLAVLYLSVGHHLRDEDDPRRVLHSIIDRAAPGSHLAFTQAMADDVERGAALQARMNAAGVPWQTRSRAEIADLFEGLEPVEPGLVDVDDWRPDPNQPPLPPVDPELQPYIGATKEHKGLYEYGGVFRKPA
ncbi:SAM-dependent methyltransferase [Spirillospora sp. NPDC127200]